MSAVSYTHLDVYKRQIYRRVPVAQIAPAGQNHFARAAARGEDTDDGRAHHERMHDVDLQAVDSAAQPQDLTESIP